MSPAIQGAGQHLPLRNAWLAGQIRVQAGARLEPTDRELNRLFGLRKLVAQKREGRDHRAFPTA